MRTTQIKTILPSLAIERREDFEWLDLGQGTDREVADNLVEMDRINRYLGGDRALFRHLLPRIQNHTGMTRIADFGTGGGGLLARVARWAASHQRDVRVVGLDWSLRNLLAGTRSAKKDAQIGLIQADASCPPFAPGSADYVISTLFLHHFPPQKLIPMLQAAYQLSSHGIVMSDLVRGWLPLFFFRLGAPIFARNRFTRHDGALSILRAYQPGELLELARQADLPNAQVFTHFPWRMTLVVDK